MKAILVIDIPDDATEAYENFTVDYDLRGTPKDNQTVNESIKYVEDCHLKPMPNYIPTPYLFRQMQIADGLQNSDGSVPVYSEDYMNGWNACLEEMLGDNE